jgi:predicted DNA-binding WGR domain protein
MDEPVDRGDATGGGGAPFAPAARFVSVDPAQNRARWYELGLQPTLWGGVSLVRAWGRLGAPGRWRAAEFPDRDAAVQAASGRGRRRARTG